MCRPQCNNFEANICTKKLSTPYIRNQVKATLDIGISLSISSSKSVCSCLNSYLLSTTLLFPPEFTIFHNDIYTHQHILTKNLRIIFGSLISLTISLLTSNKISKPVICSEQIYSDYHQLLAINVCLHPSCQNPRPKPPSLPTLQFILFLWYDHEYSRTKIHNKLRMGP